MSCVGMRQTKDNLQITAREPVPIRGAGRTCMRNEASCLSTIWPLYLAATSLNAPSSSGRPLATTFPPPPPSHLPHRLPLPSPSPPPRLPLLTPSSPSPPQLPRCPFALPPHPPPHLGLPPSLPPHFLSPPSSTTPGPSLPSFAPGPDASALLFCLCPHGPHQDGQINHESLFQCLSSPAVGVTSLIYSGLE